MLGRNCAEHPATLNARQRVRMRMAASARKSLENQGGRAKDFLSPLGTLVVLAVLLGLNAGGSLTRGKMANRAPSAALIT